MTTSGIGGSLQYMPDPYKREREPSTIEPEPERVQVLDEARRLVVGDRNKSYGSPTQNFQNTADLWTIQLRHKLKDGEVFTASEVAQLMVQLKMARMIAGSKRDNWVDVAGYASCGAECDAEKAS